MSKTREQMIDRLIEETYEGMDYKALWYFFEYHQQREFAEWSNEEILTEYNEYFTDEQESECN